MSRLYAVLIAACLAAPAAAVPVLSDMEARLDTERLPGGGTAVHLLTGGPFGPGGLAHGLFDAGGAGDLAGVPPEPILWRVQTRDGDTPPDGVRLLSFVFDEAGNFSGVDPSPFFDPDLDPDVAAGIDPEPFRIFLAEYPPDPILPVLLGELDFTGVTGAELGSLEAITGLALVRRPGGEPDLTLAPFTITAVPAPAPLALLAAAAGVLASMRFRAGRVPSSHD